MMNNKYWDLFLNMDDEEKELTFWMMCAVKASAVGCDSNKSKFREVQMHPKKSTILDIAYEANDNDPELYEKIYDYYGEPPYDMEANF